MEKGSRMESMNVCEFWTSPSTQQHTHKYMYVYRIYIHPTNNGSFVSIEIGERIKNTIAHCVTIIKYHRILSSLYHCSEYSIYNNNSQR